MDYFLGEEWQRCFVDCPAFWDCPQDLLQMAHPFSKGFPSWVARRIPPRAPETNPPIYCAPIRTSGVLAQAASALWQDETPRTLSPTPRRRPQYLCLENP